MTTKTPFFTRDYESENGVTYPRTDVNLFINGKSVPIHVLVDTGCDDGLALTKDDVKQLKLVLPHKSKLNSEPLRCELADNNLVGLDVYEVEVELAGEKKVTTLDVINPNIDVKETEQELTKEKEEKKVIGLLGREFLDYFDIAFIGTSDPKKVTFSK